MKDGLFGRFMGGGHPVAGATVAQVALTGEVEASAVILDDAVLDQSIKDSPDTVDLEVVEAVEEVEEAVKFIIPAEEEDDLLEESEFDMDAEMGLRIRKAGRTEFFKMNPAGVFSAFMLPYKSTPDAMDETTYWVVGKLRGKVANDLRKVKYLPCYSCASKRLFIMPVKVSDTDWYRSLEILFRQPREFFDRHAIRIKAEKELGRYRIMYRQDADSVSWPTKSTAELVTDALGSANIISSPDHPIYQELISGMELK